MWIEYVGYVNSSAVARIQHLVLHCDRLMVMGGDPRDGNKCETFAPTRACTQDANLDPNYGGLLVLHDVPSSATA